MGEHIWYILINLRRKLEKGLREAQILFLKLFCSFSIHFGNKSIFITNLKHVIWTKYIE